MLRSDLTKMQFALYLNDFMNCPDAYSIGIPHDLKYNGLETTDNYIYTLTELIHIHSLNLQIHFNTHLTFSQRLT